MSFEVYLQAFANGEAAGFPLDSVRNAFGPHLAEVEPDFWQVRFEDGESCDLFLSQLGDNPQLIHNISVHRPCNDRRLWDGLYTLLAQPGSVFYFPGSDTPLARDTNVVMAMPEDMVEALGIPVPASSGEDLRVAVESA